MVTRSVLNLRIECVGVDDGGHAFAAGNAINKFGGFALCGARIFKDQRRCLAGFLWHGRGGGVVGFVCKRVGRRGLIAVHYARAGQQPGDARQSDIGGGLHVINLVHTRRNAMEIFQFLSI